MSKIELKQGIFIEGFDDIKDWQDRNIINAVFKDVKEIYSGKTSEIPEEIASQCCKYHTIYEGNIHYKEYGNITWSTYPYIEAKESIQSACNKEYCIIYKTE